MLYNIDIMELVSKLRWVLVVLAILLLLAIAGWGVAAIARNVISSFSGSDATISDLSDIDLVSADTVRYTVSGPVVATEDHRSYTIEASKHVVIMRVYSNYGQIVVKEKSYQNNELAYDNLLESLDNQSATRRLKGTDTEDDFAELGACSSGRVHVLEIGDDIRRWRTSCEGVLGTAGGNMVSIRKLFAAQVPDFREMIKGTKLI